MLMQTCCSFKSAIEKSTKTMTEAQEKNHTDPIHLFSRTPLGQLMWRAVTYTHQAGADRSNAPLPLQKKKILLFLGPPSYYNNPHCLLHSLIILLSFPSALLLPLHPNSLISVTREWTKLNNCYSYNQILLTCPVILISSENKVSFT